MSKGNKEDLKEYIEVKLLPQGCEKLLNIYMRYCLLPKARTQY